VAGVLAAALQAEMPCLARGAIAAGNCAAYRQAHLDEATVLVTGAASDGRDGQGEARALAVLSAIAADRPNLLLDQAVDGRKLLDYRAAQTLPGDAASPAPASAPVAPQARDASLAGAAQPAAGPAPSASVAPPALTNALELVFKMNVPAIPAK
jgi:hypothetical protein